VPKKRKPPGDDLELLNAAEIAGHLAAAADLIRPTGVDLEVYDAFVAEGMLAHAWEHLRDAAGEHSVPFAFWTEMSKAADLLGGAP
jgi:hypothetical protein